MTGKIDYCLIAAGTIGALATLVGALAYSNPLKSIWIMLVIVIIIIIVIVRKPRPDRPDPAEEPATDTMNVPLLFVTITLGMALAHVVFLNPQQLPPGIAAQYPVYWYGNPVVPIVGPLPPGPVDEFIVRNVIPPTSTPLPTPPWCRWSPDAPGCGGLMR